jgi:D-amino-acid oxidase
MTGSGLDALVLGAGVIGLTTAVQLAESGLRVEVRTAVPPELTTSAAAGAIWGLYYVQREDCVVRWSRETLQTLIKLADEPASGVRLVRGVEASRSPQVLLDGVDMLPGLRKCEPSELPPGFATGFEYTAPLLDMPVYLGYLTDRLHAAGATLRVAPVDRLANALDEAAAVVNCTGIRARELSGDDALYPVRGQVVVTTNPGITDFFAEDSDTSAELLYILPHEEKVVLGGTAEPGRWSLTPDPAVARAIVARCAEVIPALATAPILEHRVGLRPNRPRVRLDEELAANGTRVIHSYGHGGSGVSLSWGCAFEVSRRLLSEPSTPLPPGPE